MSCRKSIIPFILICSLAFSLMGGVIPAAATDLPDFTPNEECCICDDCKTCEECYTCDDCRNCEECYTCDTCKVCEECYACDGYKNCEECYICDDCKTCEECYTCDNCKNCEECYTCDDCRTDDDLSPDVDPEDGSPGTETGDDSSNQSPEDDLGNMSLLPIDALTVPTVYDATEQFVGRLYTVVLERGYDTAGLNYWVGLLKSGAQTGVDVAYGFFFSNEFVGKGVSNTVYVDILYKAILGRNSDTAGRAYWLADLNAGLTREYIFAGFVNSIEFTDLCRSYGITRGNYTPPLGGMARVFATRLYRTVLQREPDTAGLDYWQAALVSGGATGASVAYGFLFSPEMYDRNLTDDRFVEVLYNSMLGRSSDAAGKDYWVNFLRDGVSRYDIYVCFVNSLEFGMICENHGIIRGTATPSAQSGPLSGKVIFLDPGHGTSGSPGAAGYNEAVAMLDLARKLRTLLEAQGARVILTRDSETNIPISVRCAIINIETLRAVRATRTAPSELAEIDRLIGVMQSIISNPGVNGPRLMNVDPFNAARQIHPDLRRIFEITNNPVVRSNFLVISLHSNATGNGSTAANGAEVFFIDPGAHANTRTYYQGFSYTGQSRSFGNILLNHIHSTGIVRRSNGLRADNFAIIREINVPAVLAENGFHTNPSDRALLSNPAYRQSLATAYRNAITEYFR